MCGEFIGKCSVNGEVSCISVDQGGILSTLGGMFSTLEGYHNSSRMILWVHWRIPAFFALTCMICGEFIGKCSVHGEVSCVNQGGILSTLGGVFSTLEGYHNSSRMILWVHWGIPAFFAGATILGFQFYFLLNACQISKKRLKIRGSGQIIIIKTIMKLLSCKISFGRFRSKPSITCKRPKIQKHNLESKSEKFIVITKHWYTWYRWSEHIRFWFDNQRTNNFRSEPNIR